MAVQNETRAYVSVYQGRYRRSLGKIADGRGGVSKKKFLLGTDLAAAEVANRLLEQLWKCVVDEHADAERFIRTMGGRLGDVNLIDGIKYSEPRRRIDDGPVWRPDSLAVAEAVRKGRRQVAVEVGDDADRPDAYVERIDMLQRQYPVVAFVPASPALYSAGQQEMAEEARQVAEEAQDRFQTLSRLAKVSTPAPNGQTLYQAIDAYAKFAVQKNLKNSARRKPRA
jgi:hypothetical protein